LFGVDNGYLDPDHHHSKSSFYYDEKGDTKVKPFKIGKDFSVPGNFAPTVLTDEFMYVGNVQMGRLLESFKPHHVSCFNCSNGAKIDHAIPLSSSDIILTQVSPSLKQTVIEHIKNDKFKLSATRQDVEKYLEFDNFELSFDDKKNWELEKEETIESFTEEFDIANGQTSTSGSFTRCIYSSGNIVVNKFEKLRLGCRRVSYN
jgi:hypothetical protein